jgi:hypothetical protein
MMWHLMGPGVLDLAAVFVDCHCWRLMEGQVPASPGHCSLKLDHLMLLVEVFCCVSVLQPLLLQNGHKLPFWLPETQPALQGHFSLVCYPVVLALPVDVAGLTSLPHLLSLPGLECHCGQPHGVERVPHDVAHHCGVTSSLGFKLVVQQGNPSASTCCSTQVQFDGICLCPLCWLVLAAETHQHNQTVDHLKTGLALICSAHLFRRRLT